MQRSALVADKITTQVFYVKKTDEDGQGQLSVGIDDTYELCTTLTRKTLPPTDVFAMSLTDDWFRQAFDIEIKPAKIDNLIDQLTHVQDEYETHNSQAKQLKAQRTALIKAALVSDARVQAIRTHSRQSIYTIQEIANDLELSEKTRRELDEAIRIQDVETTKRRLKMKNAKPKNKHEQEWIYKWQELKSADKQRRESKKNHNGDEWWGADITEDEYEQLQHEVETMLF
jgi:hypothetical protein